MITFHNDNLAPAGLCRLLDQVVPHGLHVPVRFHNRRKTYLNIQGKEIYPIAVAHWGGGEAHIDINMNTIFGPGLKKHRAPSTGLWRYLLEICLHEFGHFATAAFPRCSLAEYELDPYGPGRKYVEWLADEWRDRKIDLIQTRNPSLGQPRQLTGYFRARLAQWEKWASGPESSGSLKNSYVTEIRCRRTGGQLTAGEVLLRLGFPPYLYTNCYQVLRRASSGVGIDYRDHSGRLHKLYQWGDLAVLKTRIELSAFKERKEDSSTASELCEFGKEEIPF